MPRDPKKRKDVTPDRQLEIDETKLEYLFWYQDVPEYQAQYLALQQSINERKIINMITGRLPDE